MTANELVTHDVHRLTDTTLSKRSHIQESTPEDPVCVKFTGKTSVYGMRKWQNYTEKLENK